MKKKNKEKLLIAVISIASINTIYSFFMVLYKLDGYIENYDVDFLISSQCHFSSFITSLFISYWFILCLKDVKDGLS